MFRKIVIDGILSAVLLMLISFVLNLLPVGGFIYINVVGSFIAIIVIGLVFGVINALLVPLVMRLFRRAQGTILFVVTLIVDAAALMLTASIASRSIQIGGMLNGWLTAIIVGAILAAVAPLLFRKGR